MATYIVVELLTYYNDIAGVHEVLMDCGKFHVTHYVTFLLSTGRSEHQQYSHRLNHCVHGTVGTVLACLNYCTYCVYWVVFILAGRLTPDSNLCCTCLLVTGGWLLLAITITAACLITSDSHAPRYIEESGGLPLH